MNLSEKYRPRRLAEIVGQPQIYKLMALAARPRRSCWLLEGPPGVGKSCTAHALAKELGCSIFSKHPLKASDLNKDTAEQLFNHTLRCVPMDRAPVHLVILEEFERCVSADVRAFLKGALDTGVEAEDGGLPSRCVVVATSNDSCKIEPALLERFKPDPLLRRPRVRSGLPGAACRHLGKRVSCPTHGPAAGLVPLGVARGQRQVLDARGAEGHGRPSRSDGVGRSVDVLFTPNPQESSPMNAYQIQAEAARRRR